MEHLADLRSRVRDEPPPGGNTARIRLQLPNGSKVHMYCVPQVVFVLKPLIYTMNKW